MNKFVYGTFVYEYQLIRQERKTLSLTIRPDLTIILRAPTRASNERIQIFLKKKWFWLEKQLSVFKKYQRKIYQKEYVSGEGFLYLGRQYTLSVKKSNKDKVQAVKGKLIVESVLGSSFSKHIKHLIESWYNENRNQIFQKRLIKNLKKFEYKTAPDLTIRDMKRRWGSFTKKNRIILNPKLILAGTDCIDYVIVHELCHFQNKKHNKKFHSLLEEKYPKWEKVKEKLEMYAI